VADPAEVTNAHRQQSHHEADHHIMYLMRRSPMSWGRMVFPTPVPTYFRQLFTTPAVVRPAVAPLALDIRQTDDAYVIQASVPGFSPEDVNVTVDGNWLVIQAQHTEDKESNEDGWMRRERRSASVYRRLALPEQTDVDAITASVANGELSISVPRGRAAEPHRIPVTAAVATPTVGEAEASPATGETA
jgi:HSP20 family protein